MGTAGTTAGRRSVVDRELRFEVMGTWAHVVLVDGPADLAGRTRDRLVELDRKWSRFRPDSELSQLHAAAGTWHHVTNDTRTLVRRGVEGWLQTRGRFDPTVLGAVVRAGYDRDFDEVRGGGRDGRSGLGTGCGDIALRGNDVLVPAGVGLDSGGLGKGLAADLVTREAITAGAAGVCVNLGGDLRVRGRGPDAHGGWTVSLDHPERSTPVALIGLADGAVATSSTLQRRWTVGAEVRHHLIDPTTGRSADTDVEWVTVVARDGWLAEVLAKAVLLGGSAEGFASLAGTGAEAMAVTSDGRVHTSAGFGRYLGATEPPARVA